MIKVIATTQVSHTKEERRNDLPHRQIPHKFLALPGQVIPSVDENVIHPYLKDMRGVLVERYEARHVVGCKAARSSSEWAKAFGLWVGNGVWFVDG